MIYVLLPCLIQIAATFLFTTLSFCSCYINHNPKPVITTNQELNLFFPFFLFEYNLLPLALFDPDTNYLSYSQCYLLIFGILTTTLNQGIAPKNTHTTCSNWEHDFLNQSFTHKKKKDLHGCPQSLVVDLLSTKLLFLPYTIFSCLSAILLSTLPPLIALLTTLTVPTPRGSCFHKRTNLYIKNAF